MQALRALPAQATSRACPNHAGSALSQALSGAAGAVPLTRLLSQRRAKRAAHSLPFPTRCGACPEPMQG